MVPGRTFGRNPPVGAGPLKLNGAVRLILAGGIAAFSTLAHAAQPWPDSYLARLQALAALETLNADLLSHESATLTLDRWCEAHGFARSGAVTAERVRRQDKPVTAEQRRLLDVGEQEPIRYRRVRLSCGGHVLSEADNWYVPSRLTPEMNQALDTSDIAFGRAVSALRFHRRTLSAALLWRPLPEDWQIAPPPISTGATALVPPDHVLEHKAVLALPDGTPFSEVIERYTSEVLAFPEPPTPQR